MSDPSNISGNAIGVEVTSTVLRGVTVDPKGALSGHHAAGLVRGNDVLPQIVGFINELRTRFGGFDRIGVTFPGLIQRDSRSIAYSNDFPEFHDVDLLGELEKATRMSVLIENDANSAGYGEFRVGAGKGCRNLFYVTLGSGVGGALIIDGRIWHGESGFAGEFGFLSIDEDGTRLEDVASGTNIVRRTRHRFHQDSTSSLGRFSEDEITVADVVKAAHEGDDFAHLMLQRTGRYVGTAIAGVINLLDVERIVVGGEITDADHTLLDAIIVRARELSFRPTFDATSIVAGQLGDKAAAIGVALLSRNSSSEHLPD
jgi:glucokinase